MFAFPPRVAATVLAAVFPSPVPAEPPPPPRVVVLATDLNNLSNQPDDPAELPRLALLTTALRARLAAACGYDVVPLDSATEASAHVGVAYAYAHPEVAAQLAASVGAEWVVALRLNRIGSWVAEFEANVVRVRDSALVGTLAVSLRGFGMGSDLTARLTERGAASMADQVAQAIDRAAAPRAPVARRCPP